MPGSKKGERRGNANPNHVRKTAAPPRKRRPKVKASEPNRLVKRVDAKDEFAQLVNRRQPISPARMERDLEMYFTITGRRERLPKDVLLSAMRYFEESAIDHAQVLRANMMAAAQADSPEAADILNRAVTLAENNVDKYVSMAADVAFKAAPFLHPRLAAVMTQSVDKDNQTLFSMLMRDLDEAGKPARYIEHDPNERAD